MDRSRQASGCLFGAPTEFLSVQKIRRRWPPSGPIDDTQRMLAVGEALVSTLAACTIEERTTVRGSKGCGARTHSRGGAS